MKVLFLGEGSLDGPARYLAAVLTWAKIPFDHRPDGAPLPKAWCSRSYSSVILSDYRYQAWTPRAREWLIHSVQFGTGLMMIGGWASFTGLVGKYAGTDIEQLLPVTCYPGDDRINRVAVLTNGTAQSVVVCGFHRSRAKPGARTELEFRELSFHGGQPGLGARHPALVLGRAGKGRTAAFLTDCAPHWAGSLVDWGPRRVRVTVSRNNIVEVGEAYLKFFKKWITWTAACLLLAAPVHAAKVIMKDGKIYEGKIVAETDGDVLMRTPPTERRPKLLLGSDILSIVRDPMEVKPEDPQRYISIETLLTGNFFSTENISLDPSAGLRLGGGLRFHPAVELGGALEWRPAQSGELSLSDGVNTRGYEHFYSYSGGFTAKFFPLYFKYKKVEPYLLVGYEWSRMTPKASGDALKGHGIQGGIGAQWPCGKKLFFQTRFTYDSARYNRVFFLKKDGSFDPPLVADSYSLALGIGIHL